MIGGMLMEQLKKLLGQLVQGLVIGLGFGLTTSLVYAIVQSASTPSHPAEGGAYEAAVAASAPAAEDAWVFSEVEKRSTADGRVIFTGKLTNKGKTRISSVNVEVNLFQGDKFVDQYSSYISGTFAAGASRYFKVACGCKDAPPAEHDSYKIQVTSSY